MLYSLKKRFNEILEDENKDRWNYEKMRIASKAPILRFKAEEYTEFLNSLFRSTISKKMLKNCKKIYYKNEAWYNSCERFEILYENLCFDERNIVFKNLRNIDFFLKYYFRDMYNYDRGRSRMDLLEKCRYETIQRIFRNLTGTEMYGYKIGQKGFLPNYIDFKKIDIFFGCYDSTDKNNYYYEHNYKK